LLNIVSAFRAAVAGEWMINSVHFAERHALFVIISLGEALVAIGASASERGLSARVLGGLVSAAFFACVLWWMYFAYVPSVVEHQLRTLDAAHRATAARDLFTFGHFPVIAGIVAYAVVVKHMVPEPNAALVRADRSLLAAAVVVIVGGYLHLQWRVVRRLARERLVAVPVVVVLCAVATRVAGALLIAAVALVLLVMQMITWRGFRRGPLNSLVQHH
jgi:low temperature requirement protein LtrA